MRKIVDQRDYGEGAFVLTILEHRHNPGQVESLLIEVDGYDRVEIDLHSAKTFGVIESPEESVQRTFPK